MSSTKLPKLAMNGTASSASRTFHAFGAPKTGFASSSSRTFADAERPGTSDFGISDFGLPGVKKMPPGCPTAPSSALSAFTASAWNSAVGVRERRAADDRDRRLQLDQLAREALDALSRRRR